MISRPTLPKHYRCIVEGLITILSLIFLIGFFFYIPVALIVWSGPFSDAWLITAFISGVIAVSLIYLEKWINWVEKYEG